jgi:glycosyltransferase involved in cell wall biosynthesis
MNKKVSILFFGKLPPPYIGPAVATELIIKSDLSKQFDIHLFDISHHKSMSDLGKLNAGNFISAIKQYIRLIIALIKIKPDLVYMPSQQTTIAYLRDIPFFLITKIFGKKLVCHLRGGYFKKWYDESNKIIRFIIRQTQKLIDAQIVLGENLRYMYSDFMPTDRIFVVPNAADYPTFECENDENDVIKVLFLGNFIKTKGVLDVLNSFFYLTQDYKYKVQYLFAGNWIDNEVKIRFDEVLNEYPKAPIKVIGPVVGEEKFKLLSNADIFVFPSYYRNEGHPWVIIEAIASGLAVISTNHAAIPQSVVHNENGFLVEKNNPEEIAHKIMCLIDSPTQLNKMKNSSIELYKSTFKEKNLVKNMSFVFNKVLSF